MHSVLKLFQGHKNPLVEFIIITKKDFKMSIKELTLYSYFYSSASWRVRAVLALKKIPFRYETVHLLNGGQHSDDYVKTTNPMHQVPSLKVVSADGQIDVLTQSLAIIDFLEQSYPENSVYPQNLVLRAKSKAIAETISSGIQPLQNLETLVRYTEPLKQEPLDQDKRKEVAQFWLRRKLEGLENLVKQTAGKYCVGDEVTIADICLVPQMFNAKRFAIDLDAYPVLKRIDEALQEVEIFKVSHPLVCPDAPKTS